MNSLANRIIAIATLPLTLLRLRFLRRRILSGNHVSQKPLDSQKYFAGMCNICGCDTSFIYSEKESYRESLFCIHCKTISRYRSIARGILRAIKELTSIEAQSISRLPTMNNTCLRIYDTQRPFYGSRSTYPIPDLLSKCKWITVETSIYNPARSLGSRLGPHESNQNIEKLTFADSSFDIVITSDVMEHVRLDDDAYREIGRVLKPGGFYIFTVPSNRHSETQTRVQIIDPSDASQDQFVVEKEFHADTRGGKSLAYRIYGKDLDQKLNDLGMIVDYEYQNIPELGILETELFYCKVKDI
jgi:O-antigen biosynthesis protein